MLARDTCEALSAIRDRYIFENADSEPDAPPSLDDLADEYGIPHTVVRRASTAQNWRARRQQNKDRVFAIIEDSYSEALVRVGADRAKAMSDIVTTHLTHLDTELPKLVALLATRLHTMDNAELLRYFQLLQKTSADILKLAKEDLGAARTIDAQARTTNAVENLTQQLSEIANMVDTLNSLPTNIVSSGEKDEAFELIEEHGKKTQIEQEEA